MGKRVGNLTPHVINLYRNDGQMLTFGKTGTQVRVDMTFDSDSTCCHCGIEFVEIVPGQKCPSCNEVATELPVDGVTVRFKGRPSERGVKALNAKLRLELTKYDYLIVSSIVLDWVDDDIKHKVFSPDTASGMAVRGEDGRIEGVRGLVRKS